MKSRLLKRLPRAGPSSLLPGRTTTQFGVRNASLLADLLAAHPTSPAIPALEGTPIGILFERKAKMDAKHAERLQAKARPTFNISLFKRYQDQELQLMEHWVPGGLSFVCNSFIPKSQELQEDEKRVLVIVAFRRLRLKALRTELRSAHKMQTDPEYMTLQTILKPWDPHVKDSAVIHEALDHWVALVDLELSEALKEYAQQGRGRPSEGSLPVRQLAKDHLKLLQKQLKDSYPRATTPKGDLIQNLFWPAHTPSESKDLGDESFKELSNSVNHSSSHSEREIRIGIQSKDKLGEANVLRGGRLPHLADGVMDHPLKAEPRPPTMKVPQLAHGLDRVLFNPAVHWVQDPHSRVYNFPPHVQTIPDIHSFSFDKISRFVRSSADLRLQAKAVAAGKSFVGSTSSLTFILSHIYHLLSRHRPLNIGSLSSEFLKKPATFTNGMTSPGSVSILYKNGIYAVDSGSGADDEAQWDTRNILSYFGTMLENFVTSSPSRFNKLLKSSKTHQKPKIEAYNFAQSKNFLMRAQLDCYDPRLPGTGIFDIKTRAAVAIRHDRLNYEKASGYQINRLQGLFESFEREFYDLTRSALLKYCFQARIGQMDGIFVAYHNTAKMFGFQYLTVADMDERLFGSKEAGPRVFAKCVELLDVIAEAIEELYPEQSTSCLYETSASGHDLRLWLRPLDQGVEDPTLRGSVTELNLSIVNRINGIEVQDSPSFDNPDSQWSVDYELTRTTSDNEPVVWDRYKGAVKRLSDVKRLVVPPGVSTSSEQEMRTLWEDIDFQKPSEPSDDSLTITPSGPGFETLKRIFKNPYPLVHQTRTLAEQGRRGMEADNNLVARHGTESIEENLSEGVVGEGTIARKSRPKSRSKSDRKK